jgi:hypothetical protein
MSRSSRSIPVGIRMEHRLHLRLQSQICDRLSDPVRDRRHTKDPQSAVLLRYLNRSHRRRDVAPRGHSIPELVEVPQKVRLKRLDRLLVDTRSPLVGPDSQPCLPDQPFGNLKRLAAGFGSFTSSSRDITVDRRPSQDDPPPSLDPHYRASSLPRGGPPLCPASVLNPFTLLPLGALPARNDRRPQPLHWPPQARNDRFTRSIPEPRPSSRHLHAGDHLGSTRVSPRLIPDHPSRPGFDLIFPFRHVSGGSLSLAFSVHTCRAQWRDFPATLTTTALNRSSLRWFAATPRRATAEDHQPNRPPPSSPIQHRSDRPTPLLRFLITFRVHTLDLALLIDREDHRALRRV